MVDVDTLRITGLRVKFEIMKSLRKEPNTAKLSIYNLAEPHRRALQEKKRVPTRIEAGYPDNLSQIFIGNLRNVYSSLEGEDWVTHLEAGDGELAMRTARLNESYRTMTFEQALTKTVQSMKVGLGNSLKMAKAGKFQGAINEMAKGMVLRGPSVDVLDRLSRAADMEWSIQDGQILMLGRGKALEATAVLLTKDTGLIGSPEIGTSTSGEGKKKQKRTFTKLRSLMQPDIFPGRKVEVESRQFRGFFRCEKCTYNGDNWGQEWYVDIEARALQYVTPSTFKPISVTPA